MTHVLETAEVDIAGMVITQAESGQSHADLAGSTPAPWMDPGDDGTVGVHAIPAELQRRRAGTGARLIDFHSGHHPFLSQPEAFADSIAAEIEPVG